MQLVVAATNQNALYKKHMFCRKNVNKIKMDEICRICHELLPKKHRRTIFGDTFSVFNALCTVIGYVPHPDDKISRYVCGYCFTKLNKLTKIEYDLAHRLDSLTAEKNALIITLRSKDTAVSQPLPAATLEVGGKVGPQLPSVTPTKKRPIILSHTTRKVKKPVTSPRRILPQPGISSPAEVIQKGKRISVNSFSPDKVKVSCFVKFIVELQCIVPPPPLFFPPSRSGAGFPVYNMRAQASSLWYKMCT